MELQHNNGHFSVHRVSASARWFGCSGQTRLAVVGFTHLLVVSWQVSGGLAALGGCIPCRTLTHVVCAPPAHCPGLFMWVLRPSQSQNNRGKGNGSSTNSLASWGSDLLTCTGKAGFKSNSQQVEKYFLSFSSLFFSSPSASSSPSLLFFSSSLSLLSPLSFLLSHKTSIPKDIDQREQEKVTAWVTSNHHSYINLHLKGLRASDFKCQCQGTVIWGCIEGNERKTPLLLLNKFPL